MSKRSDEAAPSAADAPAGACGLYCGVCGVYLATREDPERLAHIAGMIGQTVEETSCDGCGSPNLTKYCLTCRLVACAHERGHEFCVECSDFPCSDLEAFGKEWPHRAEILPNLRRIAEIGCDRWAQEVLARHACPECGTVNSAYFVKCRRCGHEPSCDFVSEHLEEVRASVLRARLDT